MKTIYHKMFVVLATIIALLFVGVSSASAQGIFGCHVVTESGTDVCRYNPGETACNTTPVRYYPEPNRCNGLDLVTCDTKAFDCILPTPRPTVTPGSGTSDRPITIYDGCSATEVNTAIGCVPVGDSNALIAFFITWSIGIAGGIAFLLIVVAGFIITTSRGDPTRLKAGQELLTSAIAGVVLLVMSLFILRIVGVGILGLPIAK